MANFPLFSLFLVHIPLFRENYYFPPIFKNSPLFWKNSPAFYILYVYFVPPYFGHDVFMHHPMQVLDAPDHTLGDIYVTEYLMYNTKQYSSSSQDKADTTSI